MFTGREYGEMPHDEATADYPAAVWQLKHDPTDVAFNQETLCVAARALRRECRRVCGIATVARRTVAWSKLKNGWINRVKTEDFDKLRP